jgi:hypothetical protein
MRFSLRRHQQAQVKMVDAPIVLADDGLPQSFVVEEASLDLSRAYQLSKLTVLRRLQKHEEFRREKEQRGIALQEGDVLRIMDLEPVKGYSVAAFFLAVTVFFFANSVLQMLSDVSIPLSDYIASTLFALCFLVLGASAFAIARMNQIHRKEQKRSYQAILPSRVRYSAHPQNIGQGNEILLTRSAPKTVPDADSDSMEDVTHLRVSLTATTADSVRAQTEHVMNWVSYLQREADAK